MRPERILSLAIGAIFLPMLHADAGQSDAAALFKTLEPSVVLISDEEGGGSGVVISEDGLILTCYHVVNTPLDLSVDAIVEEDGKTARKSFPRAEVIGVHKRYDLALLKVDAPGIRFHPAELSESDEDTVAGGTCYAIGFPFLPDGGKPSISITRGIISAPRREMDGVPYIQLDAAINPGNSGGALINDDGMVIGIPTIRIEGSDRIGLASPVANVKREHFIDPADREGDPAEALRLSNIASTLLMRDAFSLQTDDEAVVIAIHLQRQALALEPNNAEWSTALARMNKRMQRFPLTRAYAENAVRLDPDNLYARMLLADAHSALDEPAKAAQQRLACLPLLTDETESGLRNALFTELASELAAADDHARAVYVVSWDLAQTGSDPGPAQRLVLQRAARAVSEPLIREIMDRKSGHSIESMEEFAREAANSAPPEIPAAPQVPERPERSATVTAEVSFGEEYSATLADAPPGVRYDAAAGVLEWTPVPFSTSREVRVLFLLQDGEGNEEFHVETMRRY